EIAILHRGRRHRRRGAVVARPRVVDVLKTPEKEGSVSAIIKLGDNDWSADRQSRSVGVGFGARLPSEVTEEVIGGETARLKEHVAGAVKGIGPGFYPDAGHAALGVTKLSIISCSLDLEFLNYVSGRHVRGDNFVAVRPCRAGGTIDRQVTTV